MKKKKEPWTRTATLELKELVKTSTLEELAVELNCTVSRLLEKCRKHGFPYTRTKKGEVVNVEDKILELWGGLSKDERCFCFKAYTAQMESGTNAMLSEKNYQWEKPNEISFIIKVGDNCFVTGNAFRKLLKIKLGLDI